MTNLWIYLISTGVYSSYVIEGIAVHNQKFSSDELKKMMREVKRRYLNSGCSTKKHFVDEVKVGQILNEFLLEKEFQIIYPVGEFHYGNRSNLEDLSVWANKEPSALRIGLA